VSRCPYLDFDPADVLGRSARVDGQAPAAEPATAQQQVTAEDKARVSE